MWVGVMHHVCNEHLWATGCCQHEPLEEGSQDKPWMEQGDQIRKRTEKIKILHDCTQFTHMMRLQVQQLTGPWLQLCSIRDGLTRRRSS